MCSYFRSCLFHFLENNYIYEYVLLYFISNYFLFILYNISIPRGVQQAKTLNPRAVVVHSSKSILPLQQPFRIIFAKDYTDDDDNNNKNNTKLQKRANRQNNRKIINTLSHLPSSLKHLFIQFNLSFPLPNSLPNLTILHFSLYSEFNSPIDNLPNSIIKI